MLLSSSLIINKQLGFVLIISFKVIRIMSHQSTPRSGFSQKQQVISNLQQNEDSLLDESNSFDLKNQIYELTSKYNNLQYEKNKMLISYENVLKEQKQKYAILERLCSEKQEKEEKLNNTIIQLRSMCSYLTEENEALKRDLHSIFEKNRITPDFNTIEIAQEMNMLGDLIAKEERVQKIDRQLQQAKESEFNQIRQKIAILEKENKRLKQANSSLEAEKNQTINRETPEVQQNFKAIIKFKDTTIQKLQQEYSALTLQLQHARQANLQRNSQKNDEYAQYRRKEEKIMDLEQKMSVAEKQRMKVQNQNSGLQQDNRRLQGQRKILEKSKKALQEEILRLTNEISQLRAATFNQKIQAKKQVNLIRAQIQQQKYKLRSFIDEKAQQNKRLRDAILTLNDENQELRDKLAAQSKQIEKIIEENHRLSFDNEKYIKEGNKWQDFGGQSTIKVINHENQEKIAHLQQQSNLNKNKAREAVEQVNQLKNELQRISQQLKIEQQLVQIMKFEKDEYSSKIKESNRKLKQIQQTKNQKQKVILNLQAEIRTLKDDNRHLQLANEQLNERLQTIKTINSDVQEIKHQLQLEKNYYEQMRRQQQELRKKHKRSEQFKANESSKQFRSQPTPFQTQPSMKLNSIDSSREKQLQVNKQMQILRVQNYYLQVRINQVENELNKKGIDINMKQEQILKLKEQLKNPREINFQPIIQTSKKTQFNAIFLQNKILSLEKEIMGIKTFKDKEYEQYKKKYRKKLQEKYLIQINRSSLYISQLQKNIELLNNKLKNEVQANKQLNSKLEQFTKLNYQIKYDYSQTLEEFNSLLQRYKQLQDKHKQLEIDRSQIKKILQENNKLRTYLDQLNKNTDLKSLRLSNAHEQIQKLNQTLMLKQSELKLLKYTSPNSSFIGSQRGQQKSGLLNIPGKQQMEMHPSSDNDSLQSWIKKSPSYSRV